MLELFEMIRTWMNSIPPCNVMNCVPDWMEHTVIQFIVMLDQWLSHWYG